MKSYPSIKRFRPDRHLGFQGHTFAKLDGSNLRFEWEKKRGWFRFGTRRRVINEEHETFGVAMGMFMEKFAQHFEACAVDQKWAGITVYCEFWGRNSFAGEHESEDTKFLTPIDIAIYKRGMMETEDFLKRFNGQFDLQYLGQQTWDKEFVNRVEDSSFPGMAFEGVVGKNGQGHKRLAVKLKSKAWIAKVIEKYGEAKAQAIIES